MVEKSRRVKRVGRVTAATVLAVSLGGPLVPSVAAACPVASAPAAHAVRSPSRPVPPDIARRLAALARSASGSPAGGAPRAAGVRPIPDSNLSTDLPTRISIESPYVKVPFTIVAPANTYPRPLGIVELIAGAQVPVAVGIYGRSGQNRFEGLVILDTGSIREFGDAFWAFGVYADDSGDTGEGAVLSTTVKLRSLLGQSVTRSGEAVRVFGSAKAYDPTAPGGDFDGVPGAYRPRVGQTVHLQRYTSRGWTTLRTLRTDARGHVDATVRVPFRAGFRLTTRDSATTFGATTASAIS